MYIKSIDSLRKTSVFFILKPAKAIYGFIICVCFLLLFVLFWVVFFPVDDVVKGECLLRPVDSVSSIKCVVNGQINSKNFTNDATVNKGDLLFSLDTKFYESEKDYCKRQLVETEYEITKNIFLLNVIKDKKYDISFDDFVDDKKSLEGKKYLLEKQQYDFAIKEAKINLEREENQPQMLKVSQNIEDMKLNLEKIELEYYNWENSRYIAALDKQKELELKKQNLQNQMVELERLINNSTIYSPITGRILEVQTLNVGDFLLAGVEVIRVIPQNEECVKAEIYISSNDIAKLKVENEVKIKFPSLSPSQYGITETKVKIIPPDLEYINDKSVFVVETDSFYPILSTKKGQTANLIPGLSGEARVVTAKTTIMKMILNKLDFIN